MFKAYKEILKGIMAGGGQAIVEEHGVTDGELFIPKQRFLLRGNRFVQLGDEKAALNWLKYGRTTKEAPADRFDPTQYPEEHRR
jgi:hypothetical protein